MPRAERRRVQDQLSEESSEAAETAKKVVSAMTTSGEAWIERQAELLEQVDHMSKR